MAITPASITRGSVISGLNTKSGGSTYCATCGKASNVTTNAFSGSYAGRDSYVCATCNKNSNSTTNTASASTYGRANVTTSSYCPSCNKTHQPSTHWSGGTSSTSTSSNQSGTVYGGLSWVR